MDSAAMIQLLDEVAELVVRPRFRALGAGEVEQKAPGDFVTVADREAAREIVERLRGLAPGALLVGEESTFASPDALARLPEAALAYTIDPIDGTANFVKGSPDYALMVAEVRSGQTTRAWIWQPEYRRSYVCERGGGVYRDGERLAPVPREGLPVGAASSKRYHGHHLEGAIAPVVRSSGSAAFDYPNLMEGRVDYLYYKRVCPWDHLGGTLMVGELGGLSKTMDGAAYGPATPPTASHLLVAASAPIWEVANRHWPQPS
ncbi:MAG: inositol monophosphatase [Propionibacteriaceae bacterium]|nr:inositol monophosphatase [Propionibacteriaceae bacterium]